MTQVGLYQSVLHKLADIPSEYLQEVDQYLDRLNRKSKKVAAVDVKGILELAGAWKDMSKEELDDFIKEIKEDRKNLFNREFEL